ncbi:hypothetical protein BVX99_02900 [bacterium F16]|nr:hypothetical protein BVX99_02900 [bacterium F16]
MEGLFEADTYTTPPSCPSLLKRLFLWNLTFFYLDLLRLLTRGAIMTLTGRYTRQRWFYLSLGFKGLVERQGAQIDVAGMNNFRQIDGPVVYVANHMSMLETIVLPGFLIKKSDLCIVMKEQLFKLPIFGTLLKGFRTVSVTRNNPVNDYKTIIRDGSKALSDGYSVLIFPQSTRTTQFSGSEFNTVGVKLARKAGVPVVPVALKTDFWQVGTLVKELGPLDRSKPVRFKFGHPIAIESRSGKPENQQIIEYISSTLADWQATDDR